jgi:DNA repair protein RecN (Recombination protein N)
MKELGTRLIDIHSQHQTLLLGNSMFQLRVIDAYAGAATLSGEYRNAWGFYLRAKRAYYDGAGDAERERADYDYYSHQLEELQAARLTEGEQEALEQEQERLTNAGEIKEALMTVTTALSGDGPSAHSLLRTVRNSLAKISGWLPGAAVLEKRIDTQLIDLNDISYEAEKLNSNTADDPGRLEQVTARLDTIWSLLQKHRCRDLGELLARQEQIAEKVSLTAGVDERITGLKKSADEAYAAVAEMAGRLSAARREAVGPFTREITAMLRKLGMPHARFETDLLPSDMPGPSGLEKAEFMFSANRQVAPEELSRCASGGELSRLMLCLKSVLASSSGLPAIIFDEIDSGVSGEVASMVGDILEEMGRSMQVINITHLPQVASRGSLHYHVYKEESDHSTITRVRLLNTEERIREIARLLSGSTITEAAMRNARELLKGS